MPFLKLLNKGDQISHFYHRQAQNSRTAPYCDKIFRSQFCLRYSLKYGIPFPIFCVVAWVSYWLLEPQHRQLFQREQKWSNLYTRSWDPQQDFGHVTPSLPKQRTGKTICISNMHCDCIAGRGDSLYQCSNKSFHSSLFYCTMWLNSRIILSALTLPNQNFKTVIESPDKLLLRLMMSLLWLIRLPFISS